MKKLLSLSYFILQCILSNYAQSIPDSTLQRQSYLFDHFINGSVKLKSGYISQATLNYCAYDQTILFEQEGKIMTLTGLEFIDTIIISGKNLFH